MPTLVLASQSPRRKELLEQLQIPFIQQPADIEEVILPALHPTEVVQELALQKAPLKHYVFVNTEGMPNFSRALAVCAIGNPITA